MRALTLIVAGALAPLGFAPLGVWPLALLSLGVLFVAWRGAEPAACALRGLAFGLGVFAVGVSWVYVSLHRFGGMAAPLAGLTVIVFVLLLALFPALAGWVHGRLGRGGRGWVAALVAPSAWILFEWLRGWVMSGFPWLSLGYSMTPTPLSGYAAVGGVYLVGLLAATSVSLPVFLWPRKRALTAGVALVAAAWLGGAVLGRVSWAENAGRPLEAALVQTEVSLARKWDRGEADRIQHEYLTASARAADADLVVWPEAALPVALDALDPAFWATLVQLGPSFVFGVVERDSGEIYNSVAVIGEQRGLYRKEKLVPFGEYLPLRPVLGWVLDHLQIPMSDFSSYEARQRPLPAAGALLGVSICYEDAFPAHVRKLLPEAGLLVNVSEDGWFGESLASAQRLQMARLRAMESARPMLRASSNGYSAHIDHRGAVVAISDTRGAAVLRTRVQPMRGSTPYVRWGDGPAIALVAVLLVLLAAGRRRASGDGAPHRRRAGAGSDDQQGGETEDG